MRRAVRIAAIGILFVPALAGATGTYMGRLPVSTRFRCQNCHLVDNPTPAQARQLNPFGEAFKSNGFRWDVSLAAQRSDTDNCTNGFELGDSNGDGILDSGVHAERNNPGEMDCTLQLNEAAWSTLKQLFR